MTWQIKKKQIKMALRSIRIFSVQLLTKNHFVLTLEFESLIHQTWPQHANTFISHFYPKIRAHQVYLSTSYVGLKMITE